MTAKHALRLLGAIVFGLCTPAAAEADPTRLEHVRETVRTSEGLDLAAYVSRPKGKSEALPAIFATQAVSCGSIAPDPERLALAERMALEAGYALIRVERSGTGDSQGPGCDQLDYDTEVRHYREAFDQLASHPWVDPGRIAIFGRSLGSTTAPLVAQGKPVIGVMVQGAGALTYFERMVHFDRWQLERQDDFDPTTLDAEMRRRMEFQNLYLNHQMTPALIERRYPHLEGVWESLLGTDAAPHYGRPHAWHWQAAEKNWLAAWARLEAPVMVIYGEFEQFEARHGHRIIVDTVNRLRPGTATWLEIPRAGHVLRVYENVYAAYKWQDGDPAYDLHIVPMGRWLREIAER